MGYVVGRGVEFGVQAYKAYADGKENKEATEACPSCLQLLAHEKTCKTAGCRYHGLLSRHGVREVKVKRIGNKMYKINLEEEIKDLPTYKNFVVYDVQKRDTPENIESARFGLSGYYLMPKSAGDETYQMLVNYLDATNQICKVRYIMRVHEYKGIVSALNGQLYVQQIPYFHQKRSKPSYQSVHVGSAKQKMFNRFMNTFENTSYDEVTERDSTENIMLAFVADIEKKQLEKATQQATANQPRKQSKARKALVAQRKARNNKK